MTWNTSLALCLCPSFSLYLGQCDDGVSVWTQQQHICISQSSQLDREETDFPAQLRQ